MPGVIRQVFFTPDGTILFDKNVSANDRNWSTRLKVYDRLFIHHTLNSIHRDYHFVIEDMVPNDSLDFALSSIYIHNEDYNVPKCYVPMQPQTLNIPLWIVHQNGHRSISSELSKPTKDKRYKGKQNGPVKKKAGGPRISIATTSSSLSKKQTNKYEKYLSVGKKLTKMPGHKSKNSVAQHKTYNMTSSKSKYIKSSSSKRTPLSSGVSIHPTTLYAKTRARTRDHDQISSRKKYIVTTRDVKSSGMMKARSHEAANEEVDVLDKTRRRESYAAQMRAIERIHPSSLKLAVDGPHSDQTNPGYSRKIDGTLYGI